MSQHDHPKTYLDRLVDELAGAAALLDGIVEESTIKHHNWNDPSDSVVVIGFADYGWGDDAPGIVSRRMKLLGSVAELETRVRGLFPHPTPGVSAQLDESFSAIRRWLERDGTSDWSVPDSIEKARPVAAAWFADLQCLLEMFRGDEAPELYVVPDTNALLANPDLATYTRAVGDEPFEVVLLPTVLSELDTLKDRGGHEVGRKAQAFIRRLKGLRDKGRLSDGVALTRSITVRALSRETDPSEVLDWLDPTVMDDRILGASLRCQAEHPHGRVVLVTSDLNLQNKADAVGLPYEETPATDAELSANVIPQIERRGRERHWVLILRNEGPKRAQSVTAKVTTPPDLRPVVTAGPYEVGDLQRGDDWEAQLALIGEGEVLVAIEWHDGVGSRIGEWRYELDAEHMRQSRRSDSPEP